MAVFKFWISNLLMSPKDFSDTICNGYFNFNMIYALKVSYKPCFSKLQVIQNDRSPSSLRCMPRACNHVFCRIWGPGIGVGLLSQSQPFSKSFKTIEVLTAWVACSERVITYSVGYEDQGSGSDCYLNLNRSRDIMFCVKRVDLIFARPRISELRIN